MGYIRHHAIVVTGQHEWHHDPSLPTIHDARKAAVEAGCRLVTEVVGPGVNGTSSFLVAPDGSKEGWNDSDDGDTARDAFIAWMRGRGAGGFYSWAEVVLGDDDGEALVERNAWDDSTGEIP
jgi:hypothetical protein